MKKFEFKINCKGESSSVIYHASSDKELQAIIVEMMKKNCNIEAIVPIKEEA